MSSQTNSSQDASNLDGPNATNHDVPVPSGGAAAESATGSGGDSIPGADLEQAALGAAASVSRSEQLRGHGQKLMAKQEALIAALLTERTYSAAATKAGISEATLYRWLNRPAFARLTVGLAAN